VFAVAFFVLVALAVLTFISAVWNRQINTLYGDAPLDLGMVFAFIILALVSVVAFGVALTWERSRMASTAPAQFVGEDDRDPGDVRTSVRDGEVKRVGGKW
jgi:hypothetical protein